MLVGWSENCSVLGSSGDWQLVLLDRGETVHQLHGLVHAPGQGRVHVIFLSTVRVERSLVDFSGQVTCGLAELLGVEGLVHVELGTVNMRWDVLLRIAYRCFLWQR